MLETANTEFYASLNDTEKTWVATTLKIANQNYNSVDELQTALYAVVKTGNETEQELKAIQKRYFQILYNLLLGAKQGPKLGIFLMAINKQKLTDLLTF